MRNIHTIAVVLLSAIVSNAQSVFFEDFEAGVPGQFTQEYLVGSIDWASDPTSVNIGPGPGVFEGDSSAFFYQASY